MKKNIIFVILTLLLILPLNVFAEDISVTYNSGSNGKFDNNSTTNVVTYSGEQLDVVNYSYTENLNSDSIYSGEDFGNGVNLYGNRWNNSNIRGTGREKSGSETAHVITIEGASKLSVELYYSSYDSYDWVSVFVGNHPEYTADDYNKSDKVTQDMGAPVSNNKFYGKGTNKYTINGVEVPNLKKATLSIPSNSVTFAFETDNADKASYMFGYFAVVKGLDSNGNTIKKLGNFQIKSGTYKEPIANTNKVFFGWDKNLEDINTNTSFNAVYKDGFDLTFKSSNNGTFSDGSNTKIIPFYLDNDVVYKVAHSSNINDSGVKTGVYNQASSTSKTITINEASNLLVYLTYELNTNIRDVDKPGVEIVDGSTSFYIKHDNNETYTPPKGVLVENERHVFKGNSITFTWKDTLKTDVYGWYAKIIALDENLNEISSTTKIAKPLSEIEIPVGLNGYYFTGWDKAPEKQTRATTITAKFSASKYSGTKGCTWAIDSNGLLTIGKAGQTCTLPAASGTYVASWPWLAHKDEIKNVKFVGTVNASKIDSIFASTSNLEAVDFTGLKGNNVTSAIGMFYDSGVYDVNLESLNLNKLTNGREMFCGAERLISVKLPNTSLTDVESMFHDCTNLTSVSLRSSGLITTVAYAFENCTSLPAVDISSWSLQNTENASGLFSECKSLETVNLGNLGIKEGVLKSLGATFSGCEKLKNIDVSSFKTSAVTTFNSTFRNCKSLESLNVSGWDTSSATTMTKMFLNCESFKDLDLSSFRTPNVATTTYMFSGTGADNLDISNFDFSSLTNADKMFGNTEFGYGGNHAGSDLIGKAVIKNIIFPTNTSAPNLESANYLFAGQKQIKYIDMTAFSSPKLKNLMAAFGYCPELEEINLSNFTPGYGVYIDSLIASDEKLKGIDLSKFQGVTGDIAPHYSGIQYIYIPAGLPMSYRETNYHTNYLPDGRWMRVYDGVNLKIDNSGVTYSALELANNWNKDTMAGVWVRNGTTLDDTGLSSGLRNYSTYGYWNPIANDVWEYVMHVDDPDAEYYLSEQYMDGFVSDIPSDKGYKIIKNGEGHITNTSLTKTSSLTIGKTVTGTTEFKPFKFRVTLTGDKIAKGIKEFDGFIFKDGVGEVFVKHGETVTIDGIPVGTSYLVEELDYEPYEAVSNNNTGIIDEDGNIVTYTNKFIDVHAGDASTDVTLGKVTEGLYVSSEYTIYGDFSGLTANRIYTVVSNSSHGTTFTADSSGNAFVEFTLSPNEVLTIQDLPIGSLYRFTEKEGPYYSSYNISDSKNKGKIASTAGSNTGKNVALSTGLETVDDEELVHVVFTNRFQDFENLKISKTVTGEDESETRFEFTVVFNELPANASFESDIGRITADDEGRAEKTFLLADGESVEFTNVPVGTRYYFKESPSVYKASFNIEELKGAGGSITKTSAANATNKKELQTAIEVIEKGEYNHVIFTNSPPQTKSFTLKKELLEGDANKDFGFTIYLKDVNNPIGGNFNYTGSKSGSLFFNEAGYASISLKKDQYIVINGLPQGATIAVKENDYTGDGYAVAEVNAVVNGTTTSVNVENNEGRYSVVLDNDTYMTVKNGPANMPSDAVLTVKKNVSGNLGNKYKDFEFDISATGIENFAFTKNGAALTPTITSGKTTITLKHNDVLTITAPVGTQITIEEHDYTADGYSTYIGNSLTASRSTTVTLEEDSEVIFNNSSSSIVSTNVAALHNLVMIITLCSLFIILLILVLLFSRKYKEKRG